MQIRSRFRLSPSEEWRYRKFGDPRWRPSAPPPQLLEPVAAEHQGRGIATEAAAAWRDYGFEVVGLTRIVSMISAGNIASRRVAEKLGFALERPAVWDDSPMLMYSLCNPARVSDG